MKQLNRLSPELIEGSVPIFKLLLQFEDGG